MTLVIGALDSLLGQDAGLQGEPSQDHVHGGPPVHAAVVEVVQQQQQQQLQQQQQQHQQAGPYPGADAGQMGGVSTVNGMWNMMQQLFPLAGAAL